MVYIKTHFGLVLGLTCCVCVCVFQLAVLQEEWRGRSLSSQLMTGAELEESSTTDGFQHPRIRSEPATSYPL